MAKWLTYDLESTFLKRGMKRKDTLIIEIGMFVAKKSISILVNPLKKFETGKDVMDSLEKQGQCAEKSINFWTKLMIGKKLLNTAIKRKTTEEKAEALALLLKENPNFISTSEALNKFIEFSDSHKYIAHNGRAFDSKIIKGNCEKHNIDHSIQFMDSLPMFKQNLKGMVSYSQPLLYKAVFNSKYFAHHADEDAKALHKLISNFNKPIEELFLDDEKKPKKKSKKTELRSIKGIGPKSEEILNKKGILTIKQLHDYVRENSRDQFMSDLTGIHHGKRLYDTLYIMLQPTEGFSPAKSLPV